MIASSGSPPTGARSPRLPLARLRRLLRCLLVNLQQSDIQ